MPDKLPKDRRRKLSKSDYQDIASMKRNGYSAKDIAKEFGITPRYVNTIKQAIK